ncbi:MAG: phosphatidate cytidylyltransferase [Telluria sp.]
MLTPLYAAFAGVLAILVCASTVTAGLIRMNPQRNYRELRLRIQTWWWLALLMLAALSLPTGYAMVIFGLVSFLAFKEFLTIAPTRRADHRVLLLAYLAIPVQYLWVGSAWYGMFIIFIPVYVFLLLPMRMVLIGETQGFLRAAGTIQWGLMTTVFSLSHMAYLLMLPARDGVSGAMLVFYLVVLTQLNDVAQYLWGKACGKRQAAPKVSPGKTLEGVLGGMATTTLLACLLAPWLTPMTLLHAALAGLLISLFGFIGDIVVSAVKRDIGVKDSGTLLPGHGGILDRIDSLTYTAPLFFHYIYYLYY